jgi:hypothetical protein
MFSMWRSPMRLPNSASHPRMPLMACSGPSAALQHHRIIHSSCCVAPRRQGSSSTAHAQNNTVARCNTAGDHSASTTTTTTQPVDAADTLSELQQEQEAVSGRIPGGHPSMAPPAPTAASTDALMTRAYDLCLALGITRHTSFRLVSSQPAAPIPTLAQQTADLARALSLQVEEVALLASKNPSLLATPLPALSETLVALCEAMGGLTRTRASQVCVCVCVCRGCKCVMLSLNARAGSFHCPQHSACSHHPAFRSRDLCTHCHPASIVLHFTVVYAPPRWLWKP